MPSTLSKQRLAFPYQGIAIFTSACSPLVLCFLWVVMQEISSVKKQVFVEVVSISKSSFMTLVKVLAFFCTTNLKKHKYQTQTADPLSDLSEHLMRGAKVSHNTGLYVLRCLGSSWHSSQHSTTAFTLTSPHLSFPYQGILILYLYIATQCVL